MRFFVFSGAFWGTFLILIGIALLVKHVFNIDIPVGRFIWAFLLILIGIQLLVGFGSRNEPGTALFSDSVLQYQPGQKEYNTIFGKGYLDLTQVPEEKDISIKAVAVFGDMVVKVNDEANIRVHGTSAFGNAQMPNGNSVSFGDITWKPEKFDKNKPVIKLKAESVFGQISVIR